MNYLQRIIDVSTKVYSLYLEIANAEYKRKEGKIREEEYSNLISELKDLVMQEDLCIEELFVKASDQEFQEALQLLYSGNLNLDNDILIRIINKIGKRMVTFSEKENIEFVSEKEDSSIDINDDASVDNQLFNAKEMYDIADELNLEFQRFLAFFLDRSIEDETHYDKTMGLIVSRLTNIYAHPSLESEMIRAKFHPDSSSICVGSFMGTDEVTTMGYILTKSKAAGEIISDSIECLCNNKWEDSIDDYINLSNIKCSLRSALYSLEEIHYDEILELLYSNDSINENPFVKSLIYEVIELSRLDRKKYPRMNFHKPIEKSSSIQFEDKLYKLYEMLIDLEIRKYDGEDTDFEFQKVIEMIKKYLLEEDKIVYEEMKNSLKEDENGNIVMMMAFDRSNELYHTRLDQIVARHTARLLQDAHNERGIAVIINKPKDNPVKYEIQKSFIFFLNDIVGSAPKNIRDYLIEQKYIQLYSVPIFESQLLDSSFTVSKESISFPNSFGMDELELYEYDEQERNCCLSNLNGILSDLFENDLSDEDKDAIIMWYIVTIRSALYVASTTLYNEMIKILKGICEEKVSEGKKIYADIINKAIEESILDREKYPKLVL